MQGCSPSHRVQDGFILCQCYHPQPVTQVLQQWTVWEVRSSFIRCKQHLCFFQERASVNKKECKSDMIAKLFWGCSSYSAYWLNKEYSLIPLLCHTGTTLLYSAIMWLLDLWIHYSGGQYMGFPFYKHITHLMWLTQWKAFVIEWSINWLILGILGFLSYK